MDLDEDKIIDQLYSTDVVETLARQYGYVPPLGATFPSNHSIPLWKLLHAIGFTKTPNDDMNEADQAAVTQFLGCLASQKSPHHDIWDLDDHNHSSLSSLCKISDVKCLAPDMFVFARPASAACRWILGVKSASVALYIFRIFKSNPTHNILTVAKLLISRGVPFHTLLNLRDLAISSSLSDPFAPTALRFASYKFTVDDFDAAMVQCQQILNQPQGRAALLMGGILWRIAKQYLSLDAALVGPSVEVTVNRTGYYIEDRDRDGRLWDDHLTDNETRVICGTYKMLTGIVQVIELYGKYRLIYSHAIGHGMQHTIRSWFPPHEIWSALHTSGQCWMEWTQANERWFQSHLEKIRTGKFQPLCAQDWRPLLRMNSKALSITKKIIGRNDELSLEYLEKNM